MAKVIVEAKKLSQVLRLARVTSILLYEEGSIHAHMDAERVIQEIALETGLEVTSTEDALQLRNR